MLKSNPNSIAILIYTRIFGKYVGSDEFGNCFYESSKIVGRLGFTNTGKRKRWVIYNHKSLGREEGTMISNTWFNWLHHRDNLIPKSTTIPYFITSKMDKNKTEAILLQSKINEKKHYWETVNKPNMTGTENAYHPEGALKDLHNTKDNEQLNRIYLSRIKSNKNNNQINQNSKKNALNNKIYNQIHDNESYHNVQKSNHHKHKATSYDTFYNKSHMKAQDNINNTNNNSTNSPSYPNYNNFTINNNFVPQPIDGQYQAWQHNKKNYTP